MSVQLGPGVVKVDKDARDRDDSDNSRESEQYDNCHQHLERDEHQGATSRHGTPHDGAVLGACDECVDWGIDEVVPTMVRIGDEKATGCQQSDGSQGLVRWWWRRSQDEAVEQAKKMGEQHETHTGRRAQPGQLDIWDPRGRQSADPFSGVNTTILMRELSFPTMIGRRSSRRLSRGCSRTVHDEYMKLVNMVLGR